MEYWSYVSEGKGFVSDKSISRKGSIGLELKTPCSYGAVIENQGFAELGFPEMTRKSWPTNNNNTVPGVSSCRVDSFAVEEESNSPVESNGRDSSLIDLKLGRFGDHKNAQKIKDSNSKAASMESCTPTAKSVRSGLGSQAPFCEVHGCKKDLSSSKDYYKRHKVCEVHSKTPKVLVNGIEQRFCQQCSRFHLLAEFDADKRSCRKRLAGHNERRRKPHGGSHAGRYGRLFQPYVGSAGWRLHGSTLTASSFICQDILPSNLLHAQENDMKDWCGLVKHDNEINCCPQSVAYIANGHLYPKSLFSLAFEKHFPPFHVNGINSVSGRDFNENVNQNPHDYGALKSVSGSLIQNTSIGSEDFILFDSALAVQGLSGRSASARALSLLSCRSQNSSSHSSGIPVAQSLIISGSPDHCSVSQVSGELLGGIPSIPQTSTSGMSLKFNSPAANTVEENHFSPILISDNGDAVKFASGSCQTSESLHRSCEDGPVINLLQLSSQMQRVEQENDALWPQDHLIRWR